MWHSKPNYASFLLILLHVFSLFLFLFFLTIESFAQNQLFILYSPFITKHVLHLFYSLHHEVLPLSVMNILLRFNSWSTIYAIIRFGMDYNELHSLEIFSEPVLSIILKNVNLLKENVSKNI